MRVIVTKKRMNIFQLVNSLSLSRGWRKLKSTDVISSKRVISNTIAYTHTIRHVLNLSLLHHAFSILIVMNCFLKLFLGGTASARGVIDLVKDGWRCRWRHVQAVVRERRRDPLKMSGVSLQEIISNVFRTYERQTISINIVFVSIVMMIKRNN